MDVGLGWKITTEVSKLEEGIMSSARDADVAFALNISIISLPPNQHSQLQTSKHFQRKSEKSCEHAPSFNSFVFITYS